MYAHDSSKVFYVVSGDRIYAIPLTALREGYEQAQRAGNAGGVAPAGESPFWLDTEVIELAEFLTLDDGDLRQLVPLDASSDVAMELVVGGEGGLTREALLLWGDYCDAADAQLDAGESVDDALRTACTTGAADWAA